jgi:hypothetical protein
MEHPLKRPSTRIGQMDLAGALQRYAGRDAGDGRLDGVQLQLGIGPRTKCYFAVHRRLGFGQLEFSLPLAEQIPRVIHRADVRHQHRRMSFRHWLGSFPERA